MVAGAGAGGSGSYTGYVAPGGAAGGLIGTEGTTSNATYNSTTYPAEGGTQIAGGVGYVDRSGSFGYAYNVSHGGYGSGGGSGYYGGAGGYGKGGGGGSSYISGHTGCVAVQEGTSTPLTGCTTGTTDNSCSLHYSDKVFKNTTMIDGNGYAWGNIKGGLQTMPSTTAGSYYASGVGHTGNGYARITMIKNSTDFVYTNKEEKYVVPKDGIYKIELWGAQGESYTTTYRGGYGGYTSGEIELEKDEELYIYVGGKGLGTTGGYNGGGSATQGTSYWGYAGGGATDIRLTSGTWNDETSLQSRIMVASAGGGAGRHTSYYSVGGAGGGLLGYAGTSTHASSSNIANSGGTQVLGGYCSYNSSYTSYTYGGFGYGGAYTASAAQTAGGGSGYYGGSGGPEGLQPGGGGSSYISGHTGCVAVQEGTSTPLTGCTTGTTDNSCSIHYSDKVFTNTVMIDGNGYSWTNEKGALQVMPNPLGGNYASGVGHSGNGYARITFIGGT